jgi:hypothetical protein
VRGVARVDMLDRMAECVHGRGVLRRDEQQGQQKAPDGAGCAGVEVWQEGAHLRRRLTALNETGLHYKPPAGHHATSCVPRR